MIPWLKQRFLGSNGTAAFFLAILVASIYYVILLSPSMRSSFLHAYTTHDVTQYVIVMLFVWVNSEHIFCFLKSSREMDALRRNWLPQRSGLEDATHSSKLLAEFETSHSSVCDTMVYGRIWSALNFVSRRRSSDGFREYLESLEARDSDSIHERYGFSRFVTAILPIMGLIGTVVHFGSSLSGLTVDGISAKLPAILGGIGTAFNTTFSAMSALAVTALIHFLLQRRDDSSIKQINAYVNDELLYRFKAIDSGVKPYIDAIEASQEHVLKSLQAFEEKLVSEWTERLDATQRRWEQLDQKQEHNMVHLLKYVEKQQSSHVLEIKQVGSDFSLAQKLMSELATTLVGEGKLLQLQERLVENLVLLRQTQQLEDAMHELTAAIHLFTARQNSSAALRVAA